MEYPVKYPMLLSSDMWGISFKWKQDRLRFLLDYYYDELLDTDFGREATIKDIMKKERLALMSIKPVYDYVVNLAQNIKRVKEGGCV